MTRKPRSLTDLEGLSPDEAAAVLLAHLDETDPDQACLLGAWLARSEANRRAWDHGAAILRALEEAPVDDPSLHAMRRATLALRPDRRPLLWTGGAIAAGLVATVGFLLARDVGHLARDTRQVPSSAILAETTYETARAQRSTVRLADGSVVELDSDTRLAARLAVGARDLRLERGQARFVVAHDRSRPFSVSAGGRVVTALGTRFDVQVQPGGVRVALLEGRVSVGRPGDGGSVELKPGQELVGRANRADQVRQVEAGEVEAWREGWLQFEDEPLASVVAQFNRHSREEIIIDDPALGRLRISGRFKTGDAARFIRHLSLARPVKGERIGPSRIRIVAR